MTAASYIEAQLADGDWHEVYDDVFAESDFTLSELLDAGKALDVETRIVEAENQRSEDVAFWPLPEAP